MFCNVVKCYVNECYDTGTDSGSNNSGYYELQAVLTHKGRSSSSGHYVAWVRSSKQGLLSLLLMLAHIHCLGTEQSCFGRKPKFTILDISWAKVPTDCKTPISPIFVS